MTPEPNATATHSTATPGDGPDRPARAVSRWWRHLLVALAALAALVLLLVAVLVWLATRPDGLQRAFRLADGLGGVHLVAKGVAGPVAGPFKVQHLVVSHRRVTVTIDELSGELRLGALVYGTVGIRELSARRVRVVLHAIEEPAPDTGFLPAWLRLAWDSLQVAQLDILGSGGEPQSLHTVQAAGSLSRWTLRVTPLAARWRQWSARGQLRVDAGKAVAVAWQGQLDGPVLGTGPAWQLVGQLAGEVPATARTTRWQFTANTRRPAGLAATGQLTLAPEGWQVAGRYRATGVDLAPWDLGALGQLRADLTGTVASAVAPGTVALDLAGSGDATALAPLGLGELQAQFAAQVSPTAWQVHAAKVQTRSFGSLAFTGQGRVAQGKHMAGAPTVPNAPFASLLGHWTPPGKGQVTLNAEASWPQDQLPRWHLRASGQRLEPARRLFAPKAPQSGTARLPPFDLAVDMAGTGFVLPGSPQGAGRWEIRRATLDSRGTQLELRGYLGPQGHLEGQLRVADLARWLPGHAGSLQAAFTGDGTDLARGRFGLKLEAQQLAHPAWPATVATLSVASDGQWQGKTVRAQLKRLQIVPTGAWERFGPLRLRSPATLEGTPDQLAWQDLCLELGESRRLGSACSQGLWSAVAPWEVQAHAEELDLQRWAQVAFGSARSAGQAQLRGVAAARLVFGGPGKRPGGAGGAGASQAFPAGITYGQLDVQLAKAAVHWQRAGNEGRLALGDARASASLKPSASLNPGAPQGAPLLAFNASAKAEPGLRLQLQGSLRPPPGPHWQDWQDWQEWPLQGELTGQLPALGFLPTVFEDLDRVAGELRAQLDFGGTLGLPSYRGQLQLRDGELDVVPANLQLRQVQATLDLAPGELRLAGTAHAGAGELRTQGRFTFATGSALAGEMRVQGEQLLLADVPEARVVAAPDLRFLLRGSELQVTGTVQVPSARIAPQDLTGVVLPSADERLDGEQRRASEALRTDARVQLLLGKDVQLATLGLTGRLQGTLTAHAPPAGTTTAAGELAVMGGKFKAYTRELDVEKGRLLFTGGPLADPGLDLRASRQFPGLKAGVLVRGSLRRPLVRFFSDPAKTQNEIASLLVVGRSLEGLQGTGGTGALNSATARDTALQQGGALLAAQLGKYVGLDEVQLERDQNDAAALVLGKYFSPRLYVSYGVGLTAALSALKLRYTLGNRWVIKTEAGSRQSLDLEYTTEH